MEGPKISEISQVPAGSPIPRNKAVIVCAAIADPAGVASVTMHSDQHGDVAMSLYAGDMYCGNLSRKNNQMITYYIIAVDRLGNQTTSATYSYYQK
ncbi:MAG: hypothetical protein JSV60_01280 [Desulfobacterales bacterium]|nr:MAG: hypothetical protein JSV60_01280 [Desulfobacterales bacterium]